jgi:hypothetical protein
MVPDWHREWHTREDQAKLFQGKAGMECPLCGATVMHAGWQVPLVLAPDESTPKVARDVQQAAYWAAGNAGKSLADYLKTTEGQPFSQFWSDLAVRQAERNAANNPLQP